MITNVLAVVANWWVIREVRNVGDRCSRGSFTWELMRASYTGMRGRGQEGQELSMAPQESRVRSTLVRW